jgi:S1-C subfamily serine protease
LAKNYVVDGAESSQENLSLPLHCLPEWLMCQLASPVHTVDMNLSETGPLQTFSQAVTDLVAQAATGVVAIKGAPYRTSSGVVLGPDLIATCNHVLRREETVSAVASDGREFQATLVGRAANLDVAFLKTEAGALNALPAADVSALKPGALVAVVGWTLDVGASASLGILGAIGGPRRTWRRGALDHFLRLDINLYPSQSGGAVVNSQAELIGLATPALSRLSTIAVPIDTLRRLGNELQTQGRIRHGYIGVSAQAVPVPPALREKTQSDVQAGLMLLSVEPDSPAERAGLQLGDILITLNGKATADMDDLQELLTGDSVGKTLEALLIRGGEPVRLPLTIGERPASKRRRQEGN